ncbi:MAG: MFS transporter, partial [Candidatus Eremiobacteraeota bacterium]|nr:MFS transporter [Candidatus Eremiobacteraeota bacterium]
LVGGAVGPALFGALIATRSEAAGSVGYTIGAVAMLAAAVVAMRLGVEAANRKLEDVAPPLGATA